MHFISYAAEFWILSFVLAAVAAIFLTWYARRASKHLDRLREQRENQHRVIADLSHNLQTPLAILRGKLERLEQTTLNDGQIVGLTQSVDVVARFVSDMLAFSCLEEKLKVAEKHLFSLKNLVRSVCEEAEVLAEAKDISLVCDAFPESIIFGSEEHIRDVVTNLICNAIKYMGNGPVRRIRVSLEKSGEQIILAVADTGMGIPNNELAHVFERFYRGSNRVYGSIPGTGLGLAIVESVVKEHGGAVTVTSEIGKGSTFTLILPRPKQERSRKRWW